MTDTPHQVAERIVAKYIRGKRPLESHFEMVDEIAAALTEAGDGWKPISEAPVWSGSGLPPYVLISDGKYVFVGYRSEPNYPDDPEWCNEGGDFIEPQPTHFRPLPNPPLPETP